MGDDRITPHDADELARCFVVHAPRLFGHACVLARGDRALAEDLVQATFEAAARTRATGTRVHPPRPFSNRRLLKDVPEDPLGRHPNRWPAAGLAR